MIRLARMAERLNARRCYDAPRGTGNARNRNDCQLDNRSESKPKARENANSSGRAFNNERGNSPSRFSLPKSDSSSILSPSVDVISLNSAPKMPRDLVTLFHRGVPFHSGISAGCFIFAAK